MTRLIAGVSLLALVACAAHANAQAPAAPIETDRPDFTEASSLVAPGRFQLELGATSSQGRGDDAPSQYSWPEALLRVGLGPRLELRLGQSLASIDDGTGERFTAFGDLYAGVKLGVAEQDGAMPQLAVMLHGTFPTGDARLTADEFLPGGAILAGWGTDGALSYAAGVQLNKSEVDGMELAPSLAVGLRLTPSLKAYGEWFAFAPVGTDLDLQTAHYANGGVALLLTNDVQLDGRVGFGLNDAADRVFFGLGLSIRR